MKEQNIEAYEIKKLGTRHKLAGFLDELHCDLELKVSCKELVQQGERFAFLDPLEHSKPTSLRELVLMLWSA
jgi:hypothetical protein